MSIIDISLPVSEQSILYPGNPPVKIESFRSASGSSYSSVLTMSTHTGTHVDAPRHVDQNGVGIDSLRLHHFIGSCRVLDLTHCEGFINRNDLVHRSIQEGERILCKTTNSARGYDHFYDDYVFLSGEAAEYLAEKNILLVGIDALSVKQRGSSDNTPHTFLLSKNIPILEGITLAAVEPGTYTLYAAPVKCVGLDGAPTRAVLISV